MIQYNLLMTGFEPESSGNGSDRAVHCTTTTDLKCHFNPEKPVLKLDLAAYSNQVHLMSLHFFISSQNVLKLNRLYPS